MVDDAVVNAVIFRVIAGLIYQNAPRFLQLHVLSAWTLVSGLSIANASRKAYAKPTASSFHLCLNGRFKFHLVWLGSGWGLFTFQLLLRYLFSIWNPLLIVFEIIYRLVALLKFLGFQEPRIVRATPLHWCGGRLHWKWGIESLQPPPAVSLPLLQSRIFASPIVVFPQPLCLDELRLIEYASINPFHTIVCCFWWSPMMLFRRV